MVRTAAAAASPPLARSCQDVVYLTEATTESLAGSVRVRQRVL
jgi:hypothetical protein